MLGWHVYIVESTRGALYTGITTSVARRYAEHARGRRGARFFRMDPPRELIYAEVAADRPAALRREAQIKSYPRPRKLALIAAMQASAP
jgi:putative endonuclease